MGATFERTVVVMPDNIRVTVLWRGMKVKSGFRYSDESHYLSLSTSRMAKDMD